MRKPSFRMHMATTVLFSGVVLAFTNLQFAEDGPPKKSGAAEIEGRWVETDGTKNGKLVPRNQSPEIQKVLTINGSSFRWGPRATKTYTIHGTFKADPTPSLRHIEFEAMGPEETGSRRFKLYASYKVKGEVLIMALSPLAYSNSLEPSIFNEIVHLKRTKAESSTRIIDGIWDLVSTVTEQENGKRNIFEGKGNAEFFEDGIMLAYVDNESRDAFECRVTEGKEFHEIDRTLLIPGVESPVVRAIFKLDGDTLIICEAPGGAKNRPTSFELPKNSGYSLSTYKRHKAMAKKEPAKQ